MKEKLLTSIFISLIAILSVGFNYSHVANAQFSGSLFFPNSESNLQPVDGSWGIFSPNDLDFDGELLPDGSTCSNGQILKKTGADDWDCAADATGAGGSALATQVDGTEQSADTTVYNWFSRFFNVTEPSADQFQIELAGFSSDPATDVLYFYDTSATSTDWLFPDSTLSITGTSVSVVDLSCTNCIGGTEIDETSVDHDTLSNFVANEHVDHTAVTLTAGVGLSGGGDISANRTFTFDATELGDFTFGDGSEADLVYTFNVSGTDHTLTATSGAFIMSGDLTISGGDLTIGSTAILTGGDTTSLDNIDAINATTETTLEGALDLNELQGTLAAGQYGAATIDGDDVNSNIAGNYLTLTSASPDTLDVDEEAVLRDPSFAVLTPRSGIAHTIQWKPVADYTLTRISCSSSSSASTTIQLEHRDEGAPNTASTTIMSHSIVCNDTTTATTTFNNATILADNLVSLDITATSSDPTVLRVHLDGKYDD